jgi:carbamoyltransferase
LRILGLSAYYHDSAAALVVEGRIVAAAQEERFTRKKHDARFPKHAARFCVEHAQVQPDDIDFVCFYDKPFLKFERLLETYLAFWPSGFHSFRHALPVWLREKLFQKKLIMDELAGLWPGQAWEERLLFSEHHLSHAASAFFPSPYQDAAVLTMDGVGEWATTSLGIGQGNDLKVFKELHFPHSLGLLYSAFTYYTGFKVNSGEYKVMGLAPYGKPKYVGLIKDRLIDIKEDGTYRLNLEYFDYCTGLRMTNSRFDTVFGGAPRRPESPLTQHHMDLAASIQAITEEVVLKLAKSIAASTGQRNLCLAGGVALNCVANGKLLKERVFDGLWIQPAAGDAGGAVGAALAAFHLYRGQPRETMRSGDSMQGSFLGPQYPQEDIERRLTNAGAVYSTLTEPELIDSCAQALADGKALGWHQGRMEFGPRALGGRSILGDPRSPSMQKMLNLKIKYRESFRPFAPAVLRQNLSDWFEMDVDSPYMLLVANVRDDRRIALNEEQSRLFGIDLLNVPKSTIPAVTHVDYSARIQTVHADTNPRFHSLLSRFNALSGCPVLVNTSFNVRGEPIVCTPEDAFRCFMGSEIDLLAVGDCLLRKGDQDSSLAKRYESHFEPD